MDSSQVSAALFLGFAAPMVTLRPVRGLRVNLVAATPPSWPNHRGFAFDGYPRELVQSSPSGTTLGAGMDALCGPQARSVLSPWHVGLNEAVRHLHLPLVYVPDFFNRPSAHVRISLCYTSTLSNYWVFVFITHHTSF